MSDKIRNFREDRLANILDDKTAILSNFKAKIVLHILPIISFTPAKRYNISEIYSDPNKIKPIYGFVSDKRYNIDGILTYHSDKQGRIDSYTQLFKNGIIEAVDGSLLSNGKIIPHDAYEIKLVKTLKTYLHTLESLGVVPPIFIFLALHGVKGYKMDYKKPSKEIDRYVLLIPEVSVKSYDECAEDILRPCFDAIWSACGFPRSPSYDDNGKWLRGI